MAEYPTNSRKAPGPAKPEEPKKQVEKVVSGEVIRQKKPLGRKFHDIFIGGEAKKVWSYIAMDVLVPAAKDMVSEAVSQGIDRMLFGESRGYSSPRRRYSGSNGYVNYSRYSQSSRDRDRDRFERDDRKLSHRSRANHDFDEIVLASRPEAEQVIERLFDLVTRYDQATVSDLYNLVGSTSNFTDEAWGWYDLRGAGVTKTRAGYLLDLPEPVQLDK